MGDAGAAALHAGRDCELCSMFYTTFFLFFHEPKRNNIELGILTYVRCIVYTRVFMGDRMIMEKGEWKWMRRGTRKNIRIIC